MPNVNFSNKYPYTDFHELNLDWVIKEVQFWAERVGKSIQTIALTGTSGLVDTYTITYSDESTSTFNVTNGNGIASVAKTGTVGLVDTYTITFQDGSTTTFDVHNGTASIDPSLTLSDYAADAKVTGDAIDVISDRFNVINRFDTSTIEADYYINPSTGNVNSGQGFFASDYINVSDLATISCSYTHLLAFYDAQKVYVSGASFNTINSDNTISRPVTATYMRFSTYSQYLNDAQIGGNVSRANYIPYGKFTMPDYVPSSKEIIVDISGSGDYTSLTKAIYDNVNSGEKVIVKPGTYDIVAEYVALFGSSEVANMADSDSAIFNGFQYGIIIRNREIEFCPGARVVCDWTGHTVDGTHRFSAIRVDYNCKIIGLNLTATKTFYAIHDDYGLNIPYTVEYNDCYVEGINLVNANCIGGGCQEYSKHIIKNCYFNNNMTGQVNNTVRYHNTNQAGAMPEVYVSNTYFNNTFAARWYGSQTTKMKVYVNGCEANTILKMQESASFNVDNVDLYKWNNIEHNP